MGNLQEIESKPVLELSAADKEWLIQTIKKQRATISELKSNTRFKVYEENLQLAQEVERLKVFEQAYYGLRSAL
ncbi:hypothetical protein CVD25_00995 [Bacillus canaveralius]|uniref:Uncharacterized protein n=1 Tax=Bacillus canaveralius TaxID=1403243 RepID=A0A2N5GPL1_9BACI|nr:hypothetical protein [Bacillus canaveralius]PLR84643.1 hypothetical protein CU635_06105 [Bacillus canaveralius]PLS00795.1 hypothetical protein CVD25_00995 [Bacillus canaveralius]